MPYQCTDCNYLDVKSLCMVEFYAISVYGFELCRC